MKTPKFNPEDFNPEDYSEAEFTELKRLATIGLQADIQRALDRLPPEWRNGEVPCTARTKRWLENYIKLNPGGIVSPTYVKVTKRAKNK
jgi:hypothetical protein